MLQFGFETALRGLTQAAGVYTWCVIWAAKSASVDAKMAPSRLSEALLIETK